MTTLLIATRSKGKFPEIVNALSGTPFECKNLNDIPDLPKDFEVEEPAMTFEGNAIIKAMAVGRKTGLLALADDSGIEVDALGGRPGVFSARYASGTDEDRYRKLLSELETVSEENRTARYRCVIAVYDPKTEKIRTTEGTCEGVIAFEPKGNNGFGYDPIFVTNEFEKTMAELSLEEKNTISHRGKALQKARDILRTEFAYVHN